MRWVCRNPYRILCWSTNWLSLLGRCWSEHRTKPTRGPISYDEFHQAKAPGFFGWPYFAGNNQPYTDYNWETNVNGPFFDSFGPSNNRATTQAIRYYHRLNQLSYAEDSSRFQHLGSGGKSPIAGPIYRKPKTAMLTLCQAIMEGKWFIAEWMRDWINVVYDGCLRSTEIYWALYAGHRVPKHPIDLEFSADGRLYILEYGPLWFSANASARLSMIEFNPGNRAPTAILKADKREGVAPLTVNFSATQSFDYDSLDVLCLSPWTIKGKTKSGNELTHTFTEPGWISGSSYSDRWPWSLSIKNHFDSCW